jgi:sugar-specific transcriptional regulator TrmB
MSLESKLLSVGLTDKEVAVYLAMLYLGPSTAQDISLRAKVNRATTYVMIDSLVDKGLASQLTKDKKTIFAAEDPFELLKVLENKKTDIEEKMGAARLVIPELQELFNLNRQKVAVRLFEGRESIKIIQNDLARSKTKSFDNITNVSLALEKFPLKEGDHRKVYYEKEFKVRTIFTYDAKKSVPHIPFLKNEERRLLSQDKFPIFGDILLYDNKMSMINLVDKIFGIIIEDEYIYKTYSTLFNLAWESSEKYSLK